MLDTNFEIRRVARGAARSVFRDVMGERMIRILRVGADFLFSTVISRKKKPSSQDYSIFYHQIQAQPLFVIQEESTQAKRTGAPRQGCWVDSS